MPTTTPLHTETGFDDQPPRPARPDGLSRGAAFPEPQVDRIHGVRLVAIWLGLAAAAWGVIAGVGYGLYVVVHAAL